MRNVRKIHDSAISAREATASGNVLFQAKATGLINSLAQARSIVRNSFELKQYQPCDGAM